MNRVFKIRTKLTQKFLNVAATTVTEYAIIISIVSIVAVIVLIGIGKQTTNLLETMNSNFPK